MRTVRGLVRLLSIIVFADTALFTAVAPLLPELQEQGGLSKTEAGLLFAAYPAGTFAAAWPGAVLAARAGVRAAVIAGLSLMTVCGVGFGLLDSGGLLIAARFLQGIGGALSWAGALGWLASAAPPERRGELIGTALGAAIAGALAGPLLGGIAGELGRGPVFCAFSALGVAVTVITARTPTVATPPPFAIRALPRAIREHRIVLGGWLVGLLGLTFGCIGVLVPLRMDDLGAGSAAIAAVFLIGAGLEAVVSPIAGRVADRRGRFAPLRPGLPAAALALIALGFAQSPAALVGGLTILAAPLIGIAWAPAFALLTDGSEAQNIPVVYGMALMNVTWGLGETAGAAGGSGLADLTADPAPFVLLALLFLATTLIIVQRSRSSAAGMTSSGVSAEPFHRNRTVTGSPSGQQTGSSGSKIP